MRSCRQWPHFSCHARPLTVSKGVDADPDLPRPDSDDTRALLEQAAAGDAGAVGRVLAKHRDGLRGFADLHLDGPLRARIDPSDLVQEAWADMARQFPDYLARRPMPFHLWARKAV